MATCIAVVVVPPVSSPHSTYKILLIFTSFSFIFLICFLTFRSITFWWHVLVAENSLAPNGTLVPSSRLRRSVPGFPLPGYRMRDDVSVLEPVVGDE